jgi:adenylyltransferase/sulfurtransferase
MIERYSRQSVFSGIGEAGQKKLMESRVAIMGMGALGTVSANNLARAGVGFIRLIDRDFVEVSNLQRQVLFDEKDAEQELPKAEAAYRHLSSVNSAIKLEPIAADINSSNITGFIKDVDVVIDATDNFETRMLLNEACHANSIPWIYGGAIGAEGMSMNIIPDNGPCFCCLSGSDIPAAGSYPTCSSAGVLNMVTGIVASIQCAEAVKFIVGAFDSLRRSLFYIDVWENRLLSLPVNRRDDCKVCMKHDYEYYGAVNGSYAVHLCGKDSYQVVPGKSASINFADMDLSLRLLGNTVFNEYMLKFDNGLVSFKLFSDGRAIIQGVKDANQAKSVFSEFIGL